MFVNKPSQKFLINGLLFILLALIAINITFIYVSNEHTFYAWDSSNYQRLTIAKSIDFRESPIKALFKTWQSTGRDYSDVPTLLLAPFILTFGDSRLVYILSIALVYLLPFVLVIGAIATKLIPSYPFAVYWSTALFTLLTPMVWIPTLRGYPDVGSALLIALAILVYLQNLQLKHRWQIALIGFFIATAILFRRHFVYDGIAFFVSVALQTLITYATQMRQRSPEALRNLVASSMRIGWTVSTTLITLAVLGLPFLKRVLNNNFRLLYASFEVTVNEGIRYYGDYYGWLTLVLAGLGFAAGIQNRVVVRPVATFIILFSSFSFIQWVFNVKQLGIHYSLHFTLLVVLGLVVFGWTAWITPNRKTRILVLGSGVIYVILNLVIGLSSVNLLNNTPLSQLFSIHKPPLKLAEYDKIARLVTYLRNTTNSQEPIYIEGSSHSLSISIIQEAEHTLYPGKEKLNILDSPRVDSRDSYPLEKLLQAQYVVFATPYQQSRVPANKRRVIKVVANAFTKDWEIAQDFTRLPVEFDLVEGAVVNVYKRSRPTSIETALHTLIDIHNYIGIRPGGQSNWISLSEVPGHKIQLQLRTQKMYPQDLLQTINPEASATSFLYIGKLSKQVRIIGKITYTDNGCAGASLRFDTTNQQGEVIDTAKLAHYPTDAPDFMLPLRAQNAAYLLFHISSNDKNDLNRNCLVTIEPLSIEDNHSVSSAK